MNCITCLIGQVPLTRDLYICNNCTLISSRYKSDPYLYDESYYKRYIQYKNDDIGKTLVDMRVNLVYKHVNIGTLLDYGCATGEFHNSMNHQITGHGYDINPHFGFDRIDNLDVSILTMWDSIEHLDEPIKFIRQVDADYIFISTPSTDDFVGDDMGNWRHYRPHEHVHYFNEKSITFLLSKLGYKILELNYNESAIRKSGGDKNIITVVGVKSGSH